MQNLDIHMYVFMPVIFFIYGMSFFMLGTVVLVEHLSKGKASRREGGLLYSAAGMMALFGMAYGMYALLGMFPILYSTAFTLRPLRFIMLLFAFYFLFKFGFRLKHMNTALGGASASYSGSTDGSSGKREKTGLGWYIPDAVSGLIFIFSCYLLVTTRSEGSLREAEIFLRYFSGFPASLLACFSLLTADRVFGPRSRKYRLTAAAGFFLYALTVVITPKADFFPASQLNYAYVIDTFDVPVQLFGSVFAIIITFSLFKLFRLSKEFYSIRSKAIVHILITVATPAIIVIAIGCYLLAGSLLKSTLTGNEKMTALVAESAESFFDDAVGKVNNYLLFNSLATSEHLTDVFASLVRDDILINGIVFFSGADREIMRIEQATFSSEVKVKSAPDREALRRLLKGFSHTIKEGPPDYFISGHDGRSATLEIPMSDGRMIIFLSLRRLYDLIFTNPMQRKGWLMMLVDREGHVAAPVSGREVDAKGRNIYTAPKETLNTAAVEHGESYSIFKSDIASTGWAVAIKAPRADIAAPIFHIYKVFLFGTLTVYLCALGMGLFFVRELTSPLQLIMRRIKEIGREETATALVLTSGDEVQFLAEEVEKTAGMLVQKRDLEKKVAENARVAAIGRLAAGIAHELNNPIGIIYGYSQTLLREYGPESQFSKDLKIIEKHALRCKKIVNGLLMYARESSSVQAVDVCRSLSDALAATERELRDRKIRVIFSPACGPLFISIDPDRLHQLFLNLIGNASDAMEGPGGELEILVRTFEEGTERLCEISFRDSGPGISPDDLQKIFEPFYTTKKIGKGTGLGLYICYSIVQEYKGRIRVESSGGKGTIFHVAFPLIKEVTCNPPEAGIMPFSTNAVELPYRSVTASEAGLYKEKGDA